MDELLKQVSSPVWWVSVVVAGFLINLLAAYAKPAIDRIISRFSATRKRRVTEYKERLDRAVNYLLVHEWEVANLKLDAMTTILRVILIAAFAAFLPPLCELVMSTLPVMWIVKQTSVILIYLALSILIVVRIREYFVLRRILCAYSDTVHTVESRFRDDNFPTEKL